MSESGQLYSETETFTIAIQATQDGVIATINYKKYTHRINLPDEKCQMCHQKCEKIEYVIARCNNVLDIANKDIDIANKECLKRYNLSANIIHQILALWFNLLDTTEPYYKYVPVPILENVRYNIYWDQPIMIDKSEAKQ